MRNIFFLRRIEPQNFAVIYFWNLVNFKLNIVDFFALATSSKVWGNGAKCQETARVLGA
jgi:hypothetical protein